MTRHAGPGERPDLSYAASFTDPVRATVVRSIEWATARRQIMARVRRLDADGIPEGPDFFNAALAVMGIDVLTPPWQIAHIPANGPLVVVANHPNGLVDGMILAHLVGRRRSDYKILARSLLTQVDQIADHVIPVPFPQEAGALEHSLSMRRAAMAHLFRGGALILFPSGRVAEAATPFGQAVEAPWSPFTAKAIRASGAAVVPVRFTGQNSRAYQIAARTAAILRQGLLLYEVKRALDRPQRPIVGERIPPDRIDALSGRPRDFMAWLRDHTLSL